MSFSHLDDEGKPGMVDVGDKVITDRTAVAECYVVLGAEIMDQLRAADFTTKKGSIVQTAIVAGTMAVKQTWSVIPLCHPLDVSGVRFTITEVGEDAGAKYGTEALYVRCAVRTRGRTGVEMEALHGASVAALTVYDMCKALSLAIRVEGLRVVEKTGGKRDFTALRPEAKIPHDDLGHAPIHLIYRLAGSVPKPVLQELSRWRKERIAVLERRFGAPSHPESEQILAEQLAELNTNFEQRLEEAVHQYANEGPDYLRQQAVRKIILDSWRFLQEEGAVYVYAVCVMSNHAHVILQAPPGKSITKLADIVQRHKSFTASAANKLLHRQGQSFWNPTYFDRRIRPGGFATVMWYVLNNPVKAGLVKDWRDWSGTYLNPDYRSLFRTGK